MGLRALWEFTSTVLACSWSAHTVSRPYLSRDSSNYAYCRMVQFQSTCGRVRRWAGLSATLLFAVVAGSRAGYGQQRPLDSGFVVLSSRSWQIVGSMEPSRGAATYTIDSTEIMAGSGKTLSEILEARVPALSIWRSGGVAAEGSHIQSRGPRSNFLASDPIVIVDGIRVDALEDATVLDLGVSTSRLDDIAPEDVARIDILPGAAAASLYGPGAANGALVITTKDGDTGGLHLSTRAQSRLGELRAGFPANYRQEGVSTSTGQPQTCLLSQVAAGVCTATRLDVWNPLQQASPFRTARSTDGSVSASGGVRQTTARLALTASRTLGVTADDDASRLGVRTNVEQRVGESFELGGHAAYVQSSAALPYRGGAGDASNVIGRGLFGSATNDSIRGYLPATFATSTRERADHFMTGGTAVWRLSSWFSANAIYGRDQLNEADDQRIVASTGQFQAQPATGHTEHALTTVGISATSTYHLSSNHGLTGLTTGGYQRLTSALSATDSQTFSWTWIRWNWTIGGPWLRQVINWRDRVIASASARSERPTFFSVHLPGSIYKSADLQWLVGRIVPLDSLRFRAAYGEASNWSPGNPRQASAPVFSDAFGSNEALAERTFEKELGADFTLGDVARVSLTGFRADASHVYALTIPALVTGQTVVVVGPPTEVIRNEGIELQSAARLLRATGFEWDVDVNLSTLRNRVLTLGAIPPSFLDNTWFRANYPLDNYWVRPYTYADVNHDGLLARSEVQLGAPVYVGSALPTRAASLVSTVKLPAHVTIRALFDYRGGQRLANMNAAYRCDIGNCRAQNDPTSSLADQARALAPLDAYFEDASFAKFRELSFEWILPSQIAKRLGGSASLTIAGRNLGTWTRYDGLDPELGYQPMTGLPRSDLAETPLPREILLRLDLGTRG